MEQLEERLAEGALVLVTGHHEVKDDEGREAQEAQHRDQGEPVHLPGHRESRQRLKDNADAGLQW